MLTLSENHPCYLDSIGETAYNSHTDVIYIFPDSVCSKLLAVMRNRYLLTSEPLAYQTARALEQAFVAEYPEAPETGASYFIRLSTLQINSNKAGSFVLQATMIYGAVVLMVMCLTILSLQQLLDAGKYRYRFSVLRKLGVEERELQRLIRNQLGVWFGLPVTIAVLLAAVVAAYFIQTVSAQVAAYIGYGVLLAQVSATVAILLLLLVCYYISTWVLFRHSAGE